VDEVSIRCSSYSRAAGLDPIGSVGAYDGYLLVEWPLPWPSDIAVLPELGAITGWLKGSRIRLQALVPTGGSGLRIIYYRAGDPDNGRARYVMTETTAEAPSIVEAARDLVAGVPSAPDPSAPGDVLICTHGRRDRCCGSLGTGLALDVGSSVHGSRRVWRTSHTGGHRFAPTAIVFPEATAWAFLDAPLLRRIVERCGSIEVLLPHYRGYAGLPSPEVQALERSVLAEVGWSLFDLSRSGAALDGDGVRLNVEQPDGSTVAWEAEVRVRRRVPVPVCGEPLSAARKSEPEFEVAGLVRRG
jgi:hypothetical protein